MKMFRCDICGQFFEPTPEGDFDGRDCVAVGYMSMNDCEIKNKTYDCCPLCISKINELIKARQATRTFAPKEEKNK